MELAEWGARLIQKGFLLEEPEDNHPLAWQRIIDPEDGSEGDPAVTMNLWQQTRKHLTRFPGQTRAKDKRPYLSLADYLEWQGRRAKGDLKSDMRTGLVVSPWNQWVEEHGGEGAASLDGVNVRELNSYLDGYGCRVCRDTLELVEEVKRRESLLESVQVGKPDTCDDERFRRRVERW